jgi:predicted 3-demethylubiquinone-9 3-methyltransferase (glyoxalase superfamily)
MAITTCLWFDGCADDAVAFYLSIFPDSKRTTASTWGEDQPGEAGATLAIDFELMGSSFLALNGGPDFKFTPAISFVIPCETQAEIDRYWDSLLADGGSTMQCGWLTDRFGVSWQVVPNRLGELLSDPDQGRAGRAMEAMMKMVKLDIAGLEAAADAE